MSPKLSISIFAMSILLLTSPGVARACSVCGLDDFSYMWSYLFLTSIPLAAMSIVGGYFFYSYQRANKPSDDPDGPSAK
ncbi:MAG: hypothetical protein HOC91_06235 [Nitrospinaceae bacterium]|jgi:hypothetical protein|nr:hypothetical protein [Nitrospinaceae bacterium]MBT3434687.1 hypothetical protein [Nitrospinaceae bacterium]MBT3820203.1 hypothetical protein [Nitrospinaceae bacterium]MBT4095937.1 hypothetical protein [Nitrospinaceae bacterium]MBT4430097.1 hypothetical protein [Nitrospinaceae bacterium]